MDKQRSMIEVFGVPDVLPADRIVDKLHVYFLKERNGGGEVLKVVYPGYQRGQAFVTFEKPEVAAQVLRKSSHILEVNRQQYHLKVKAVDYPEVDFHVEATVHLNVFHNQTQVRDILRSRGFTLRDLASDQVRVSGSFLKLRAVKASLETLLDAQAKADIRPSSSSSSLVPKASSRAIPKYYTNRSDANRSQLNKQPAPSSPTFSSSSSYNHSASPEHDVYLKPEKEIFVVDANVFDYAEKLRKKDIDSILDSHIVKMSLHPVADSYNITLQGRSTAVALFKLQSLLDHLSKSLRVQEVPLKNMIPGTKAFLERIQRNRNVYRSVLVCPKRDKLHLIGPSAESYELKQRLLGMTVDPSGRSGRTADKTCRRRSSSLPPVSHKRTDRDGVVGATGYTPSKYQDIKQEGTEPEQGAAAALSGPCRRRSNSESHHNNLTGRTVSHRQDVENKSLPLKPPPKRPHTITEV